MSNRLLNMKDSFLTSFQDNFFILDVFIGVKVFMLWPSFVLDL